MLITNVRALESTADLAVGDGLVKPSAGEAVAAADLANAVPWV